MKSFPRHLSTVLRILMGALFVLTGLNGFFHFMPQPNDMPAGAVALSMAFINSGYFMQLVMATQLVAGLLLLSNRFVPLALVLLAPVVVNIFAFHLFLARAGLGVATFVAMLEIYLAWYHRKTFAPILTAKH